MEKIVEYCRRVDYHSLVDRSSEKISPEVEQMNEQKIGREISGCETLIMKIVWDAKEDIPTPELTKQLRERFQKDYARTTVVTFLQRLADKGFITTYRKGRIAYIHALKDEKSYTEKLVQDTESFWFDGDASKLVAALCHGKKLSPEEIAEIRETLDDMDN
jgi:predicted transcriptional regulator